MRTLLIFCLLLLAVRSSQDSDESLLEKAIEATGLSWDELLEDLRFLADPGTEATLLGELNPIDRLEDLFGSEPSAGPLHREPDFDFNPRQMIEYRGFKYEEHHVVTEDCYVLEMHRLVHPFDRTPNKPPVLLQHGLEESSTTWIINSIGGHLNDKDDRNLAFALAKRGYDVWLGNYRGNTYSKNHTTFSPQDDEFWKFTYDNHGLQGERNVLRLDFRVIPN